jgi:hypothetical protein
MLHVTLVSHVFVVTSSPTLFTVSHSDNFLYGPYTTDFPLSGLGTTCPLHSSDDQETTEFILLLKHMCCVDLQQSTVWLYLTYGLGSATKLTFTDNVNWSTQSSFSSYQ